MANGTLTQALIDGHLVDGAMEPGREIALRIDQTLTQDATGTLVMLELGAMRVDRVATELSVQYVDHNLLQTDFRNPDDHLFLESACRRYGVWYSRPGNGVSHPLHMERFGVPGRTLLGSDSHTCAAGALGMLAIGAGGLEVALAMAGDPFHMRMPRIRGVRLEGELRPGVSAKDVILEMLRRLGVDGGTGWIVEYHGAGVDTLSAMDRHVIANMGQELGATTSVFPSDRATKAHLESYGRADDWTELAVDPDATYDDETVIDLSELEPLIAKPSSPENVVPVREVEGRPIYQAYLGSSANPGIRDFAVPAAMVRGESIPATVSFDVNPTTRSVLATLTRDGHLADLVAAGARIHQAGCNGCIGMGQAPATGRNSLRTVPRNFPGRSGTREDSVYLCSPETATASALAGEITDPRRVGSIPTYEVTATPVLLDDQFEPPPDTGTGVELVRGPNIKELPDLDPLPDVLEGPVLLKVGDDVSTDEILPAGSEVLPFRSNVAAISKFAFSGVDEGYVGRALDRDRGVHAVVGGFNYGQGSSREHAALAPRYLGLRLVLARGFARIHEQNLANFGVLPLELVDREDWERIDHGHTLRLEGAVEGLRSGRETLIVRNRTTGVDLEVRHNLGKRQVDALVAGSLLTRTREERAEARSD